VSPEPQDVLQVIEESTNGDNQKMKEKVDKVDAAVKDITGEMDAVQSDVRKTSVKIDKIESDVEDLKEEVKVKSKNNGSEFISLR
jgi:peptidoglycan hydrolase CwlO-like protein